MSETIRPQVFFLASMGFYKPWFVSTRATTSVKRNADRFPSSFMFQLTEEEWSSLRSQIATLKRKRGDHKKYLPYVFTEQGVAMLYAILKSKTAIQISIKIINAFVEMRKLLNLSENILEVKIMQRSTVQLLESSMVCKPI